MARLGKIKARLNRYHYGIWFGLVFLVTIALSVTITRFMIPGEFQVAVDIPYFDETQYFSVQTGYLFLQTLALGPFMGIIYYILMKGFLAKVDKERGNNRSPICEARLYALWSRFMGLIPQLFCYYPYPAEGNCEFPKKGK